MKGQRKPALELMHWSLDQDDLVGYTARQLTMFTTSNARVTAAALRPFIPDTCARLEKCFRSIRRKYYYENGRFLFSHLNGDHYSSYLYLLSNTIHRSGRRPELAQAVFLLNKMLHGIDAFYTVELPDIFLFIHPVGTILGNARYRDYFIVYQNCTVGSPMDGTYPMFDVGTVLFAKSTVIGNCQVGRNVVFGANSFVMNLTIPSGTTVVGSYPQHRLISSTNVISEKYFGSC